MITELFVRFRFLRFPSGLWNCEAGTQTVSGGSPYLREESAAAIARKHEAWIVGSPRATTSVTIALYKCPSVLLTPSVDSGFTRERIEQRSELVGSGRELLVSDDKFEKNFEGERAVV